MIFNQQNHNLGNVNNTTPQESNMADPNSGDAPKIDGDWQAWLKFALQLITALIIGFLGGKTTTVTPPPVFVPTGTTLYVPVPASTIKELK